MPDTKVFVADAASTDSTVALAELCAARLGFSLEVIPGGLPATGRNAGARRATTPYVLFMDADVELGDPTLLRRAMNAMQSQSLYCLTTNIGCVEGNLADRVLFSLNNCVQKASRWVAPFATGMFMLFDRNEFERLGGFDERAMYAEDYLLSKQVACRRFSVLSGSAMTSNRRFQKMGHAKVAWMFVKTAINSKNQKYFFHDQDYWKDADVSGR